jgi:hypothetical protein
MAMDPCVSVGAPTGRKVYCPEQPLLGPANSPLTLTYLFLPFHPRHPLPLILPFSCGRLRNLQLWPGGQVPKRPSVSSSHNSSYKMDHFSLTIPLHQTIPSSLAPIPSPPSLSPTPVPPSSFILPQHLIMSGVAKNKAGAGAKPPRPPNAWIIYRSDKLQNLPPPPLGQPKPTQAEVSKIIAAQWRAESAEVRATYDDRAETAKAEHARMYPDYRFAPMKKADKDRIREEKRQAKEQERAGRRVRARVAPYPLPSTASPFKTSSSLIIKHVVPNANSASPSMSSSISSTSLSSTIPNSQPGLDVAPYYGPTRVSLDASTDSRFQFMGSQNPSFNEQFRLGAAVPFESSSSMVPQPHHLTFSIPQHPPPEDWLPSPSAELSPLPDIPEWPQSPPSTQEQARAVPIPFVSGIANILPRSVLFTSPCLAWRVRTSRTS